MRSLTVITVGVLTLAAAAVPARAEQPQSSLLQLTIRPVTGTATTVLLACDPDSGSHPHPAEACTALRAVNGELDRLPDQGAACTKQYDPVHANAIGIWHGRWIFFRKKYGNACQLHSALDPVFRFTG